MLLRMPSFCDVALAVPLDAVFTYSIPEGVAPVVGGRVLVPFHGRRLTGMVVEMHDRQPPVTAKDVLSAVDSQPVLDDLLIRLGKWIGNYYLAAIGDVFRSMLPLNAEFKRAISYRITEAGHSALYSAGVAGSSARSRKTPDEELAEISVLDYLAARDDVREEALRSTLRVSKSLLGGMTRKKWITREDISDVRDLTRRIKVAVLKTAEGKLNSNQNKLIERLTEAGGRIPLEQLQQSDVPRTTLGTLVKRGLVEIIHVEAAATELASPGLKGRLPPLNFQFNPAQQNALERIRKSVSEAKFSGTLLHGVTGSGKTAVYLAAMRSVLESGRSAILLVPEIGLTPAMAADLHQVFAQEVAVLHSSLSNVERAEQWHRIKRGEARIVVGTRSAVFAPVSNLALIIVDEEQDSSYKQEEMPRYHARDVAVMRAKMADAVVVLGSATPSLESYFNAKKGKYALIQLPDRVEQRPLPEVEIIDMRQEFHETGAEHVISRKLAAEIKERFDRKEQVMILLNRRGYSPVVLCRTCGKKLECKNCAIAMTHHKRSHRMECHYCGHISPIPKACVHCGSEYVFFLGTGSEKLEELLHGMFPQARIGRLDRDTVRGQQDFERALNALNQGELDMLVGTQMIAKGHDIHGVTLVGVIGADTALGMPDFRAAERTFQLLTQVAGRAGRGNAPGRVVVQSYFTDHYAIQYAAQHDFVGFYEKELQFRSWMHYPPYSALANVLIRSNKLNDALRWSGELGQWFEKTRHEGVRVLGPAAAPIVRLKQDYRYHFVLKAASREKLNGLLRTMLSYADLQKIPRAQIVVDVDAIWMM